MTKGTSSAIASWLGLLTSGGGGSMVSLIFSICAATYASTGSTSTSANDWTSVASRSDSADGEYGGSSAACLSEPSPYGPGCIASRRRAAAPERYSTTHTSARNNTKPARMRRNIAQYANFNAGAFAAPG